MADYDVGVTGLSSPPSSAVVTSYRPAVSVRNNGIHNAIASGYVRIYAAGQLIFETEVYSGTLAPGASGTADGVDYWTPTAEGPYVVQGYVTTPLDQVEPNNNLNPVTITVEGGPVPPPPVVPLHAAQHEEGGTDPINVDGLLGVLTNAQTPSSHASQHQAGQADVLNVGGLAGILGDPQTPAQHGNAHHTPDMATSDELTAHAGSSAAHTAATNLANRETSGIRSGVVKDVQLGDVSEVVAAGQDSDRLSLLREVAGFPATGRLWGFPWPTDHAAMHEVGGRDPVSIPGTISDIQQTKGVTPAGGAITVSTLEMTAAQAVAGTVGNMHMVGTATTAAGVGQSVDFRLYHQTGAATTLLATASFALAANKTWTFHVHADVGIGAAGIIAGMIGGEITDTGVVGSEAHADAGIAPGLVAAAVASRFFVDVVWVAGAAGSTLTVTNAIGTGHSLA